MDFPEHIVIKNVQNTYNSAAGNENVMKSIEIDVIKADYSQTKYYGN